VESQRAIVAGAKIDFEGEPHGTRAALDFLVQAATNPATPVLHTDRNAIEVDEVVVARREPLVVHALVGCAGRENLTEARHDPTDLRNDRDAGLARDGGKLCGRFAVDPRRAGLVDGVNRAEIGGGDVPDEHAPTLGWPSPREQPVVQDVGSTARHLMSRLSILV